MEKLLGQKPDSFQEKMAFDRLIQHIQTVYHDNLFSIILFGSYARGEATPESDIDILILVDNNSASDRDKLYDYWLFNDLDYDLKFSLIMYDLQRWNYLKSIHSPFVENVVREGKTLWSRGIVNMTKI